MTANYDTGSQNHHPVFLRLMFGEESAKYFASAYTDKP